MAKKRGKSKKRGDITINTQKICSNCEHSKSVIKTETFKYDPPLSKKIWKCMIGPPIQCLCEQNKIKKQMEGGMCTSYDKDYSHRPTVRWDDSCDCWAAN